MNLGCIALSHWRAPAKIRSQLKLDRRKQVKLLKRLGQPPTEALLVSTCGRLEVYLYSLDISRALELACTELLSWRDPDELGLPFSVLQGARALEHLVCVASSLDSIVLGEQQIFGQVKAAFELAREVGTVRDGLKLVREDVLQCATRVYEQLGSGWKDRSMASVALEMVARKVGGLKGRTVLVVGAGDTGELLGQRLNQAGVGQLLVINRTPERASELAAKVGGIARPFEELTTVLRDVSVAVCATSSPEPFLTQENLRAVQEARGGESLHLVDLSIPLNIAPDVSELRGVHVYCLDDVQKFVAENHPEWAEEAQRGRDLVRQVVPPWEERV
jgi:glutamyl-tRNA reductase